MFKIIATLSLLLFFVGCNSGSGTTDSGNNNQNSNTPPADPLKDAQNKASTNDIAAAEKLQAKTDAKYDAAKTAFSTAIKTAKDNIAAAKTPAKVQAALTALQKATEDFNKAVKIADANELHDEANDAVTKAETLSIDATALTQANTSLRAAIDDTAKFGDIDAEMAKVKTALDALKANDKFANQAKTTAMNYYTRLGDDLKNASENDLNGTLDALEKLSDAQKNEKDVKTALEKLNAEKNKRDLEKAKTSAKTPITAAENLNSTKIDAKYATAKTAFSEAIQRVKDSFVEAKTPTDVQAALTVLKTATDKFNEDVRKVDDEEVKNKKDLEKAKTSANTQITTAENLNSTKIDAKYNTAKNAFSTAIKTAKDSVGEAQDSAEVQEALTALQTATDTFNKEVKKVDDEEAVNKPKNITVYYNSNFTDDWLKPTLDDLGEKLGKNIKFIICEELECLTENDPVFSIYVFNLATARADEFINKKRLKEYENKILEENRYVVLFRSGTNQTLFEQSNLNGYTNKLSTIYWYNEKISSPESEFQKKEIDRLKSKLK